MTEALICTDTIGVTGHLVGRALEAGLVVRSPISLFLHVGFACAEIGEARLCCFVQIVVSLPDGDVVDRADA